MFHGGPFFPSQNKPEIIEDSKKQPMTPRCSRWATFTYGRRSKRQPLINRWTAFGYFSVFLFAVITSMSIANRPAPPAQEMSGISQDSSFSNTELQLSAREVHSGSLVFVEDTTSLLPDAALSPVYPGESYEVEKQGLQLLAEPLQAFSELAAGFHQTFDGMQFCILNACASVESSLGTAGTDTGSLLNSCPAEKWQQAEHQTGYALDLRILSEQAVLPDPSRAEEWLEKNCRWYGFVPCRTEDLPVSSQTTWHLRYVGFPHAVLMEKWGLDLAGYLDRLKSYPWDGQHLYCTGNGNQYEIYFVPSQGKMTPVNLPQQTAYTISGNNLDGFIVTLCTQEDLQIFSEP